MKIVIAGGSGFLGSPLAEMYAEDGHDVRVLTRSLESGATRHDPGTGVPGITQVGWQPDGASGPWATAIEGADGVINLSGESLASKRWSPETKRRLRDSRILATRSLAAAIRAAAAPPAVLVSGSAVGYYGPSNGRPLTESDPPGSGFLAELCVDWEKEARQAERPETRVVLLRTGIVLERSGGALPEMMRPFKFFAGGPLGSGRQYVSWIHRLDWIEIVRWIVQTPVVSGPVNATAPHPVTNRHLVESARPRDASRPASCRRLALPLSSRSASSRTQSSLASASCPPGRRRTAITFAIREIEQAFRGIFGD